MVDALQRNFHALTGGATKISVTSESSVVARDLLTVRLDAGLSFTDSIAPVAVFQGRGTAPPSVVYLKYIEKIAPFFKRRK